MASSGLLNYSNQSDLLFKAFKRIVLYCIFVLM